MRGTLKVSGPQLMPLANILVRLNRHGIVPTGITNVGTNDSVVVQLVKGRYTITDTGDVSLNAS